ncbi:unnamed protein product [Cylindrotheca closterium]|uniref:Uncharacterized protein n=1 Tax=Cylindrotheca closterium TaxID=2856 RepID=A0AAD2FL81_9STRA|nr:unnamed protein product [Cylindrotheca closterium]
MIEARLKQRPYIGGRTSILQYFDQEPPFARHLLRKEESKQFYTLWVGTNEGAACRGRLSLSQVNNTTGNFLEPATLAALEGSSNCAKEKQGTSS